MRKELIEKTVTDDDGQELTIHIVINYEIITQGYFNDCALIDNYTWYANETLEKDDIDIINFQVERIIQKWSA